MPMAGPTSQESVGACSGSRQKSETTSRGKGEKNNKERMCVEQKQKQAERATERVTSRAANGERRTANKVNKSTSQETGQSKKNQENNIIAYNFRLESKREQGNKEPTASTNKISKKVLLLSTSYSKHIDPSHYFSKNPLFFPQSLRITDTV
jgi:hypothetical protein